MGTFNTIPHFKFWCQKVLPLVYDDSLSFYELLSKVINYLNHVIDDVNRIPEYINEAISEDKIKDIMSELLDELREQIARANEGTNTTASFDRDKDELVWLNGTLVRMTRDILAGDRYVEEVDPNDDITGNYVKTSIEIEINRVIERLEPTIESITNMIGDLESLSTEDKSSIVNAINEVIQTMGSVIGDLTLLETEDKSTIVNAINEVLESITTNVENINTIIGELSSLDTDDKSSIVNAINEVLDIANAGGKSLTNLNLYNVKDYGAKGDNSTNDTNAIKTALNLAVNNHGILYFPNGTYLCHENLNLLNKSDFTIMGSSKNAILKFVGDIEGLSFYHSDNVLVTNMTIENTINSTKVVIDFAARNGIIENCVVNGYGTNGTIKLRNHDNKIINSKIYSAKNSAIQCNVLNGDDGVNWTINNLIDGCTVVSGKYGIIMTKDGAAHLMEGLTISNCVILGEGGTALYGIWAMSIFALTISNCVIDQWKQNGIYLVQSVDTVANVRVDNCYVMGEDYAINLSASNNQPELSSITIDNNTIYSPNGKGVYVDKTYGVNISDNDFNTPQGAITCTSKSKYTRVTNNVIKAQNELATCNHPTVAIFEDNFVTNQSVNGAYTIDNPTYVFDESGHVTVTHTANWEVQNNNNVLMG